MRISTNNTKKGILTTVIVMGVSFSVSISYGQTGEELFKQNCAVCHKLGGKMVGPDLVGVSDRRSEDWIIKFVKSSQSMVKSGDETAVAVFEEFNQVPMPDQPFNDEQIKSMLTYINEKGNEILASKIETTEETVEETVYSEADILRGKDLFDGTLRFVNSGPSCISCHHVSNNDVIAGGLLAKDLTTVYDRVGEAGIGGILSSPPFPAMASSYRNNPLTEDEVLALSAFFSKSNSDSKLNPVNKTGYSILLVGGIVGFLVLLTLIYFNWNYRKKLSVKHEIFKRQIRSI